jgi:hypothetical protein
MSEQELLEAIKLEIDKKLGASTSWSKIASFALAMSACMGMWYLSQADQLMKTTQEILLILTREYQ